MPTPPPARIGWGLPDAFLVWIFAGIVGSLAQIPVVGQPFADIDPLYKFGVLLPAQQIPVLVGLLAVTCWKGTRSLRRDFGLEVRLGDARILWMGPVLQIAFLFALLPLTWIGDELRQQQLIEDVERTDSIAAVALFAFGAVIMAPLVEEGLYRGLLLRALLRRTSPGPAVFLSALIFAGVHLVGDPNTLRSLPALTGLGLILGVIALRTGSLSRPILIHAAFNLTTVLLILAAPS